MGLERTDQRRLLGQRPRLRTTVLNPSGVRGWPLPGPGIHPSIKHRT